MLSRRVEPHSKHREECSISRRAALIDYPSPTLPASPLRLLPDQLSAGSCNPVLKPRIRDFSTIGHSRVKDGLGKRIERYSNLKDKEELRGKFGMEIRKLVKETMDEKFEILIEHFKEKLKYLFWFLWY